MDRNTFSAGASLVVAVICAFAAPLQIRVQDPKAPYPSMAPLDQYLMERNAEIALARSAAPESISHDADVLVLGGMATKQRSKARTVSCVSWSEGGWAHSRVMVPTNFGTLNFEARSPSSAGSRSVLPMTYKRTEMAVAGQSKAQIMEGIKIFIKQKLPPLEPGSHELHDVETTAP